MGDLEDTNMAGVGGEEDRALRTRAAQTEPAWQGIGLAPGLWIFRIEAFQVVPWPEAKYGKFHEGDSYIILHTENDISEETGKPTDKLLHDIHFWLGKKTTTDEKGTAAYKTVELDDFFDGEPVQHREVQGSESDAFLALFPNGIQYLAGGVDSGFNVTQQDLFLTRLWQVRRNAKRAIIIEEEEVALKSLNHRDAFILEKDRNIYVWFGDDCSPFVKAAAGTKAENMEGDSHGEQSVKEIDEEFWKALGGEGPITPSDKVGAEVAPDFGEGVLFNVQVCEDRKLTVTEVGRGQLNRSMLDTTAIMMLDTRTEIFLWIGKESSKVERATAFATCTNYLKSNGRDPDQTAITVLKEGNEKSKTWKEIMQS